MPLTNVSDPSLSPIWTNASPWLNVIGGIGSLGGGVAQAGAQNNSASLAQQYAAAASQLGGFSMNGPGGVGITGNPLGAGGSFNYGSFNPAYSGLGGLASGNVGTASGIGPPNGLNSGLQGAFDTASGGLAGFNPAAPGFAGNADLAAAGGLAGGLAGGFPGMAAQQYNALQALQSPANINAANSLGNSLFGRGMLGSNSGGILGQQFGQGLAQQSAANAAAAQGLGIQALGTQANAASGLTFMGNNALNSAFSNFGNASMLAPGVQSSYLNPALGSITGFGNLTNTGLGYYNAGLQGALGQNQASARAGYLGTTNANSANQQSPYGQLLGNLFGGLATGAGGQGGLGSILQGLFGKSGNNGILQQIFGGGGGGGGDLGSVFTGAPGQTSVDWGMGGSGGDVSSATQPLLDNNGNLSNIFGPSTAGGEAASTTAGGAGNVLGDVTGGGGAAAAAYGALPSAAPAAAPGAVSYTDYLSNLTRTGYASNAGVPGAVADTTGSGAADAAGAATWGGAALGAGAFVGGVMALEDYFGTGKRAAPNNSGWLGPAPTGYGLPGFKGWAQAGGIQGGGLNPYIKPV